MQNTKCKNAKIKIAIIFILTAVAIFAIASQMINKQNTNFAQMANEILTVSKATKLDSTKLKASTGGIEVTEPSGRFGIPTINGNVNTFCIEPGIGFYYPEEPITVEEVNNLVENGDGGALHAYWSRYAGHYHYSHTTDQNDGKTTNPYYTSEGSTALSPANAYIVSSNASWEDKQRAIWHVLGYYSGNGAAGSSLDVLASEYAEYDSLVRGAEGLNPTDKTNVEEVATKVDQEQKEYTIGTFNIEYINGNYAEFIHTGEYSEVDENGNLVEGDKTEITRQIEGVAFSGISDMKVIGYNKEGKQVNDNITIKKFILKDESGNYGEAVTPEYFTPDANKEDKTAQVYPKSGQDFQVVFDDPNASLADNDPNKVAYISIKVTFKYMLASGTCIEYSGEQYTVEHAGCEHITTGEYTYTEEGSNGEEIKWYYHQWSCINYYTETVVSTQRLMTITGSTSEDGGVGANRTIYNQELVICAGESKIPLNMELGGHVWEDVTATKEGKADGISNTQGNIDKPLPNVKVTLYVRENGKDTIATLQVNEKEEGISNEELMHRINPTCTDENGNYLFKGLDPMKKYYVTFEYNGQIYLPTEYLNTSNEKQYESVSEMVNAKLYNTEIWNVTSKGTEIPSERTQYTQKFAEIGSSPNNYKTTNSLGKVGEYNETFTNLDLMGYTLNEDGKYIYNKDAQLVDGYLYDEQGLQTENYSEGIISKKIKEFVVTNKKYPSNNELKTIYETIAQSNSEVWKKLQFIEDCKINAVTGSPFKNGEIELYPVYDKFVINEPNKDGNYNLESVVIGNKTYEPIYTGQYYINLGLWRRQTADIAIRKDVYRAALKINNKTVIYKYDQRQDNDETWEINVRMSDYNTYYNSNYTRELYKSDYEYNTARTNNSGSNLELYVTYKITVRNQSSSILTQINEVVDYYDNEYEYVEGLSFITNNKAKVKDEEYYNAMHVGKLEGNISAEYSKVNGSETSKYGEETHSDLENEYSALYISGLKDKKLKSGENAYIYLTFKVKTENGKVILDNNDNGKQNLVELNGYSTYYKNGTELPNDVTKGENDIAGLIDTDSNPGNLKLADLNGSKYEKNFEDDTDRAKNLRIIIDTESVRKINGTVWEDERTEEVAEAIIGNGKLDESETKIPGIKVQLVEKCSNGTEYVWQTTTTDSQGNYSFEGYIPGEYVVRFTYGDNEATVKAETSYNGQDYKSTIYQAGINQSGATDVNGKYQGYTNTTNQNETGTYGYSILKADANQNRVSDVKDIWSRRQEVNNYSSTGVTNHKAEVLASPYTPNDSLINELIENTSMVAETGVIVVEFEYDRQQSNGDNSTSNGENRYLNGNDKNGIYEIKNLDFGLVERPKAQLEISKTVANVKVTLANGSVLFDTNKQTTNVIWQKTVSREQGLIQLSMDEELMHGSTLEITYKVKVTNVGEVDYTGQDFYYNGKNATNKVTTKADQVVDYVSNNLQFNAGNNNGWSVIKQEELIASGLVNGSLAEKIAKHNVIIQTGDLNTPLKPGESTEEKTLILTQLISRQNNDDDLTYNNIVEIVKTSNTVGRRMAYSIVGNQDPTVAPAELDSSIAEEVIILPPFGAQNIIYYVIIGIAVAVILGAGVMLIRKKVLNK